MFPLSILIQTLYEDTYDNFLLGTQSLENPLYLPAKIVTGENIDNDETWRYFASKIEVEGMLNVNSTSVEAWKSILKHLRNDQIPQFNGTQVKSVSISGDDTPFIRTSVAGGGTSAQINPGIAALAGPALLTNEQVDLLAEEIVEQIRKRGPFLSVSEFVNRRLTSDSSEEELALSGTIEAALKTLSENASADLNPYSGFQSLFTGVNKEAQLPDLVSAGLSDYAFRSAGEGSSVYGYPGWVRQADIIENLAPVMTVRDDSFIIRAYGNSIDSYG
ncbi:hypothetical protein OAB00_00375 [Akkermansiaceae bacterium]|nr:hypothetical protein [Akkermansiaceae bacterium]